MVLTHATCSHPSSSRTRAKPSQASNLGRGITRMPEVQLSLMVSSPRWILGAWTWTVTRPITPSTSPRARQPMTCLRWWDRPRQHPMEHWWLAPSPSEATQLMRAHTSTQDSYWRKSLSRRNCRSKHRKARPREVHLWLRREPLIWLIGYQIPLWCKRRSHYRRWNWKSSERRCTKRKEWAKAWQVQ